MRAFGSVKPNSPILLYFQSPIVCTCLVVSKVRCGVGLKIVGIRYNGRIVVGSLLRACKVAEPLA